jgi:hypothetical protein
MRGEGCGSDGGGRAALSQHARDVAMHVRGEDRQPVGGGAGAVVQWVREWWCVA